MVRVLIPSSREISISSFSLIFRFPQIGHGHVHGVTVL
jgi:hypothetical protein